MRRAVWLLVLLALLGAGALGWVIGAMGEAAGPVPDPSGEVDELRAEIERLENENRELRKRPKKRSRAHSPADGLRRRSEPAAAPAGDGATATTTSKPSRRRMPDFQAPSKELTIYLSGLDAQKKEEAAKRSAEIARALTDAASQGASALRALVRDPAKPVELRRQALGFLNGMKADGLARDVDDVLGDSQAPPGLRSTALEVARQAAQRDGQAPPSVHRVAADPSARADERERALRILLTADPEYAASILRGLLEDYRSGDRQLAMKVLPHARHTAFKPLLEQVVNSTPPPAQPRLYFNALALMRGKAWSRIQMTGPPDTPLAGDHHTAWAPKKQQMGEVWIEVDFANPDRPVGIRIHESFNPGAVSKVSVKNPDGEWDVLWEGVATKEKGPRWFTPPLHVVDYETTTVRFIVHTDRVPGWNEIDAVELIGDVSRQWAKTARASSAYSD